MFYLKQAGSMSYLEACSTSVERSRYDHDMLGEVDEGQVPTAIPLKFVKVRKHAGVVHFMPVERLVAENVDSQTVYDFAVICESLLKFIRGESLEVDLVFPSILILKTHYVAFLFISGYALFGADEERRWSIKTMNTGDVQF